MNIELYDIIHRPQDYNTLIKCLSDTLKLLSKTELCSILFYLPNNPTAIRLFLDSVPDLNLLNEDILQFIYRGNPQIIPKIVYHPQHRHIIFQKPSFLYNSVPILRRQLEEDESILTPNDSRKKFHLKLKKIQNLINMTRKKICKQNLTFIFCICRILIYLKKFLRKYYSPTEGKGYLKLLTNWNQFKL